MQQRGFTLLELMIAILLFSMVSAAAYKLFNSVSRAQQVTGGILDKLDVIQRAEVILEKDFFQAISRPIRNHRGDRVAAMKAPSADGFAVEFTRTGWRNPLNQLRSDLQRVAYALEEGQLIRYYWPELDRPQEAIRIRQVVLDDVLSFKVRYMDEKKKWRSSWPPSKGAANQVKGLPGKAGAGKTANPESIMPTAIETTVVHQDFGSMINVYPLITYKAGQGAAKILDLEGNDGRRLLQPDFGFDLTEDPEEDDE